jgi:hypothetical protein
MENVVKLKDWERKGSKKVNVTQNRISIINSDAYGTGGSLTVHFNVKKMSYSRRLDEIAHHMNYFLEVYDKENELIDKLTRVDSDIHHEDGIITAEFIGFLYRTVFTPSIKQKIISMVDDNFVEDEKIVGNSRISLYSAKKDLMILATAMKLIIPPIFEFIDVKGLNAKDFLLSIYSPLFEKFGETTKIPEALKSLIHFRVKNNHMKNVKMYEVLDLDPKKVEEDLYRMLVTETLFKCAFDKDAINLLDVVVTKQLSYLMSSAVVSK